VRTLLFYRKYRRFHGGHLKVWHYFNHVLAAPEWDARVLFDVDTSWDSSNPWTQARDRVIDSIDGVEPDALFIAGRDWQRLEKLGLLDRGLHILNLVQHMRHAEDWSIQSRYLDRRAIRLCVSQEVAAAVVAAGSRGPTVVIPNGIDVMADDLLPPHARTTDLLIAGLKQPVLAAEVAQRLATPARSLEVLTEPLPRDEFLDAMRRARVTLFLPNEEEGFYLPPLEGMALGTIVVCPDCIGNRSFCLPGVNALRPAYQIEDLVHDTEVALGLTAEEAAALIDKALETAGRHTLTTERVAFGRVLADIDAIWGSNGAV
jgi:glycosyltransferase involved in cell wall biosynthesis